MKQRLKQLQQTVNEATVSSHSAANVSCNKPSSVPDILHTQTCCDLPVQPLWLDEDSLLIYSPPGRRASNKVVSTPTLDCYVV